MKLKVNRERALDGLTKVQTVIGTRTPLPILSNVLLQAEDNRITFTATDLEVFVRASVEAEVGKKGGSALPARRIVGIVRELPAPDVVIESDERESAVIKGGSARFRLNGMSEDDFPPMPVLEDPKVYTIDQLLLRDMLNVTHYAASNDEGRGVITGVLVSFKEGKLTVVATDGRRMALKEQEIEFPNEYETDMVLPYKTVEQLLKTLGGEGQVRIQATANQVAFEFNDMRVVSKLIEGTFPNFRQVIPAQCAERVTVEREMLLTTLHRMTLVASERTSSVRLQFSKGQLQISASSPDVGEAVETLPVKFSGAEINVAFNPEYLMDPLKHLLCDEVALEVTDNLSPGVIRCEVPFLYVLMPVRAT